MDGSRNRIEKNMREKELKEKGKPKSGSRSPKNSEDQDENRDGTTKATKFIKLKDLEDITSGNFDASNKMGKLLGKDEDFSSTSGIRMAYSKAFLENSKGYRSIDDILADRAMDALNSVRNLLIHNNGIADEKYKKRTDHVSGIPKIDVGSKIQIDGEITKSLIDPIIKCGSNLVKAVDFWLSVNPRRRGRMTISNEILLEEIQNLEIVCDQCEGTGTYDEGDRIERRCGYCDGSGYIPTEFGKRVLALMRHNFRPMLQDVTEE